MHADDLIGRFFFGLLIDQPDMGAELHVVAGQRGGVNDLGGGRDLHKLRDAAFDEGLAFARGVVFGVFRQVSMRARLGDVTAQQFIREVAKAAKDAILGVKK